MPQFHQRDEKHYVITYISGPSHVYLGLSFEEKIIDLPIMIRRPPVGQCQHGKLDEIQIRNAVIKGIEKANTKFDRQFKISEIVYVENDSPRYDLYEYCAYLLVERRAKNGEFRPLANEKT